tara:strand:- start:1563 stop:2288 length:726 start_codon:yes stop_codon:yes gene_type:complete
MINQDKWIRSLPKNYNVINEEINQLDPNRWVNTISKNNTYSSMKKYSFAAILFVCGLILVSLVKNETRDLQKEINNLRASIDVLRFNLDQEILDNEVITSPENISKLAEEYLNTDFLPYQRSQIKNLNGENEKITEVSKIKKININKKKEKSLSNTIKTQVAERIQKKKTEIRKLQELYSNPESIPGEIKTQVAVKIEEKKIELKNIYSEPKNVFTLERVGKWSIIQVVKLFLGMPIVPGR